MFLCCQSKQTAEQALNWPVIWDAMAVIWRRRYETWHYRIQIYFGSLWYDIIQQENAEESWPDLELMMTSSNGNIFRVTGHLCGEFTGPVEFPTQSPVTRSFDVFQ